MKKYLLTTLLLALSLSFTSAQVSAQPTLYSESSQTVGDIAPDEANGGCTTISYNLTYKKSKDANTEGEVSDLQYFLQDQGFLKVEPNGYFGVSTLNAVKMFQKKYGFIASGYVGPATRAKIGSVSCNGNAVPTTQSASTEVYLDTNVAISPVADAANKVHVVVMMGDNNFKNINSRGVSSWKLEIGCIQDSGVTFESTMGGYDYRCGSVINYSSGELSSNSAILMGNFVNFSEISKYGILYLTAYDKNGKVMGMTKKNIEITGNVKTAVTQVQSTVTTSAPTVTSVTPYVPARKAYYIDGTGFTGNNNTLEINGVVRGGYPASATVVNGAPRIYFTAYDLGLTSNGTYDLYVTSNNRRSDKFTFVISDLAPALQETTVTTSVPTVEIIGTPSLSLQYDYRGKESLLVSKMKVRITAGNSAIGLYQMSVPGMLKFYNSNNDTSVYPNSAKFTSTNSSNIDGQQGYMLQANSSDTFYINNTAKAGEILAGTYAAVIGSFAYTDSVGQYKTVEVSSFKNYAKSNTVTVIGEISPYISKVDTSNGKVIINGLRLNAVGNMLQIDGSGNSTLSKYSPSSISVDITNSPLLEVANGAHYVTITNAENGNSNAVWFDYQKSQSTTPVPTSGQAAVEVWKKYNFSTYNGQKDCTGEKYIGFSKKYNSWVGAQLCEVNTKYKLYMADGENSIYYQIADTGGHGQDHCELVNQSFSIPNDDDITSGTCKNCALGEMFDVQDEPVFVRSKIGENFKKAQSTYWADLTVKSYSCGVSIGETVKTTRPTEKALGSYIGYMGSRKFIETANIAKSDALDNCKLNQSSNPSAAVRCTWNGVQIYPDVNTTNQSSSVPVVKFTGTPSLSLKYNFQGKEVLLVGKGSFTITAGNADVMFSNDVNYPSKPYVLAFNGGGQWVIDGPSVIKKGETAKYTATLTASTSILFAGTYKITPSVLGYSANGNWQNLDASTFKGASESNSVTIVGETGPYIKEVVNDATPKVNISVTGSRFHPKSNVVKIGDISRVLPSTGGGTLINTTMKDFELSTVGTYGVQVTHPATGASNYFSVNLTNTPTESVVVPVAVSGPKYNAMSCSSPSISGKKTGEVACYGVWDYGNEFGDDKDMCQQSMYGTAKTGCTVKTTACVSGTAIASRILFPTTSSQDIATMATNFKTTTGAVSSKNLLNVWEYTCNGEASTASAGTVTVGRTAGFVGFNTDPNKTSVKIGSYTVIGNGPASVLVNKIDVGLNVQSGNQTGNYSNLVLKNNGTVIGTPIGNPVPASQGTNTFTFPGIQISAGSIKVFDIYADIGAGSPASVTTNIALYNTGVASGYQVGSTSQGVLVTTIAAASITLANPTLSPTSPITQFVVGGTTFGIATFKLSTAVAGTQATVRELRFNTLGGDAIESITIGGVTAPVISGNKTTVSGLNIAVSSTGTDVPVTVKFSGFQNSITGGSLQTSVSPVSVTLGYIEATAGSGSVVTNTNPVSSKNFTLVASKPTVTMSSGGANSLVLGAENKIGEFSVASDINGKIALKSLSLYVTTAGITNPSITNWRIDGSSAPADPSLKTIFTFPNSGYEISPGTQKTFSVYGVVNGTVQPGLEPSIATTFNSSYLFTWTDLLTNSTQTGEGVYNFPTNSFRVTGSVPNTPVVTTPSATITTNPLTTTVGVGKLVMGTASNVTRAYVGITFLDGSSQMSGLLATSGAWAQNYPGSYFPQAGNYQIVVRADSDSGAILATGTIIVSPAPVQATTTSFLTPMSSVAITTSQSAYSNLPQVLGAYSSCVDIPRNLIRGSESTSVTMLQKFLTQKGYFAEEITGVYRDKTVEAVKDYQASKGLPETGMVFDFTRKAIKDETCR